MRRKILFVAVGLAATAVASPAWSQAKQKVMTITATEPMTTDNPYGESSSPVYSLWCHTYGCLGRYDYTEAASSSASLPKNGKRSTRPPGASPCART